jgi:Flp pilus assembly protein CpaB
MNKKTIIQIIVIIAAFGGAGIVLYNGFAKNPNSGQSEESSYLEASKSQEKVLPYGETLNLKAVLNQRPLQFSGDVGEKINPASDVGSPENAIITPRPSITAGK